MNTRDLAKRIESANPTEEELDLLFYWLAEKVKPKPKETVEAAISLADIWDGDEVKGFRGLSTGFGSLDELTQGMAPGQVHTYFGDTGHGKSQIVQHIAVNVAERGHPVYFVGLEMTAEENRDRFKSFGANRDTPILQPANIDLDYKALEPRIANEKQNGIELVVIDHLHMFENSGHENEANFLSAVCREVKMLAIRYDLPIILVSHISNDRQRSGAPTLSDLKGSSSIKQISDVAIAVYNDSMVNDLEFGRHPELTLVCRKNRRGRKRIKALLRILDDARLVEPTADVFR